MRLALKAAIRRHWLSTLLAVTLVAVVVAAYAYGAGSFSFAALVNEYSEITDRIAARPLRAHALGIGLYALLVVSLLPGVPLLAVPIGLIFGWLSASLIVAVGTLLGVTILFIVATRVVPDRLTAWAKARFGATRADPAFGYLFVLRLMPVVPFTLLNVALPALRTPYRLFALSTLAGMLPRILAYAYAGEGLRGVIEDQAELCERDPAGCEAAFDAEAFLTPEIIIATVLLAVVSLAPILFNRLRRIRPGG